MNNKAIYCVLLISVSLQAINESLDKTFNPYGNPPGTLLTSFGDADSVVYGLALQNDGKIIAVGTNGQFALVRYWPDGSLDNTFGIQGKMTTIIGDRSIARAVAIDSNQNILVAGFFQHIIAGSMITQCVLARYLPNGHLDTTFNSGGSLPGTAVPTFANSVSSQAFCLACQSNDTILIAGQSIAPDTSDSFALASFTSTGNIDVTFGGFDGNLPGTVTTRFSAGNIIENSLAKILIQPDQKIVAIGSVAQTVDQGTFALARYKKNGLLDNSFGDSGRVTVTLKNGVSQAIGGILQANGKLLVSGYTTMPNGDSTTLLARYTNNGVLDISFGNNGIITNTVRKSQISGIAHDLNQKIIISANTFSTEVERAIFGIARLNANGSRDSAFVETAFLSVPFPIVDFLSVSNALLIQPDGKIIVGGFAQSQLEVSSFALARYIPNLIGDKGSALAIAIKNKYC